LCVPAPAVAGCDPSPPSIVTNLVFGDPVGLRLRGSDEVSADPMVDNAFFGLGLVDGTFPIDGAQISGAEAPSG